MPVEPVKVNIFNQPYHLRTDGDGDYVRQLAQFVDERMQNISTHTSIVDYAKVAVLAALNIADELHRLKLKAEKAEKAEAVAPNNMQQDSASAQGSEGAEAAPASSVERPGREGDSWSYSDIFESLPGGRESLPKLGQNITTRLRQLRGEGSAASPQEPEE
jgi:cell division protein ZapA